MSLYRHTHTHTHTHTTFTEYAETLLRGSILHMQDAGSHAQNKHEAAVASRKPKHVYLHPSAHMHKYDVTQRYTEAVHLNTDRNKMDLPSHLHANSFSLPVSPPLLVVMQTQSSNMSCQVSFPGLSLLTPTASHQSHGWFFRWCVIRTKNTGVNRWRYSSRDTSSSGFILKPPGWHSGPFAFCSPQPPSEPSDMILLLSILSPSSS